MSKENKIDVDMIFDVHDKPLRELEREIFDKLKKMGVSFRQAEAFFELLGNNLKDKIIK
jgi:hypothetical protein